MSRASTLAKAVGSNGDIAVSGSTTLGDAAGDNITINASTASIPNGLNFDSNTLVIDSTNNRVGIGTASPADALNLNTGNKFRATHSGSVYQQIFSSASGNFFITVL